MKQKPGRRAKTGRPPAGLNRGERVRDYPQLAIRVPPTTRAKLHAMSVLDARPLWRIVRDAVECYFREHSDDEQRLIEQLCASVTTLE